MKMALGWGCGFFGAWLLASLVDYDLPEWYRAAALFGGMFFTFAAGVLVGVSSFRRDGI